MNAQFPEIYARYLNDLLAAELPAERRADCENCSMCDAGLGRRLGFEPFDPGSKCCTFTPDLANFSVGELILAGGEGQRRIEARIEERAGATPLGLFHGPARHHTYLVDQAASFGHDQRLLCPYLDRGAGRCTIWSQRDPVCATWYCRHERGQLAADFWEQVKVLLRTFKEAIAVHCLLGLAPELGDALLHPDGRLRSLADGELGGFVDAEGRLGEAAHARLWGRHAGAPGEYYVACAKLVRDLESPALRELAGVRLRALEDRVVRSFAGMGDRSLPPRLRLAHLDRFAVEGGPEGDILVRRLRVYDPLVTTPDVMRTITELEGPAPAEAWAAALAPAGDEVLRDLVDHGLLEAAPDDAPAAGGGLDPDQRLYVTGSESLELDVGWNDGGGGRVTLTWGALNLIFDEPDLLDFGRSLHRYRGGFVARDTLGWTRSEQPLSWERVAPILGELEAKGVLARATAS